MIFAIDLYDGGMAAFMQKGASDESPKKTLRVVKTKGLPPASQIPSLLVQAFEGTELSSWIQSDHHGEEIIVSMPSSVAYRADVYRALSSMGFEGGFWGIRFNTRAQMIAEGVAIQCGKLLESQLDVGLGKSFAVAQPVMPGAESALEISFFDFGSGVLEELGTTYMPPSTDAAIARELLASREKMLGVSPVELVFYAQGLNPVDVAFVSEYFNCPAIECLAAPDDVLPGFSHRTAMLHGSEETPVLSLDCFDFSIQVPGVEGGDVVIARETTIPTMKTFLLPPINTLNDGKLELLVLDCYGTRARLFVPVEEPSAEAKIDISVGGLPVLISDGIPNSPYDVFWNLHA